MRQPYKTGLLWLILIMVFLTLYRWFPGGQREAEFTFDQFASHLAENKISELKVDGDKLTVKLRNDKQAYKVIGPIGAEMQAELAKKAADPKTGFTFRYMPKDEGSVLQSVLATWLPMLVLFAVFYFFMRQMQSGGGKAMSFGKSKAKLLNENHKKVTFDDVAGVDEAKEELQEIIHFLRDPKHFTRLGGRIPKGVLLMGPPGTGKTLLARGVAGEAGVPFYSISGSDFVEMFVGVGASRVRDLFEQGKKNAPCIIFIDEIDAVGRHRGAGMGGGHDEREQTLNQLLVEMDGFESNEGVILIAATNRPDVLDPALLRPGRFDRRVVVNRPDVLGREQILKVHTRRVPLAPDCEMSIIARGTPGFSGADLENLVNEAALLAARKDRDVVTMVDFEMAKDKVLMGTERRSMIISDKEKRTTAYHEAGHALVAALMPDCDPVHKVTIIPRGRALGLTQMLPVEDRLSMDKMHAQAQLAMAMGGRVAEEIIFDQITTGAGQDIQMATNTARRMVCEWGMSEKLGPLAFGKADAQPFMGRDSAQQRGYSEATAIDIDSEVRRFVMDGYNKAQSLITENIDKLRDLAEALLARETLDAKDVLMVIRGETLPPLKQADVAETTRTRRPKSVFATQDDPQSGSKSGGPNLLPETDGAG